MKVVREALDIETTENQQFLDITKQVRDVLDRSTIKSGMLVINSLHTTVALFLNEHQSALMDDLGVLLQKLVPRRDGYFHDDPRYSDCDRGNAHAHRRAMLLGRSISLAITDGEPVLGQYQSVLMAELDGPRKRKVHVHMLGE